MTTAEPAPLERVRTRLALARKRHRQLVEALQAFDSEAFATELEASGGTPRFRLLRPIDPEWGHLVGEIANHARSVLDHLVAHTVVQYGGRYDDHRGQFPIETDETKYPKRSAVALRGVPRAAQSVIAELQPFTEDEPSTHPLATLQKLSNWDKHQDVHAAIAVARNTVGMTKSDLLSEIAIFELPPAPGASGSLGRTPISDGDDPFSILHPVALAEFERQRQLVQAMDPGADASVIWRFGVCFGRDQVFVYQVEDILDFIEYRVIPELAHFITP